MWRHEGSRLKCTREAMTGNSRGDVANAAVRTLVKDGRFAEAWSLLVPELLRGQSTTPWGLARNVLRAGARRQWSPAAARQIRLALLCTYEAAELSEYLRVACLALGIDAECYVAPYGQLEQELLGDQTPLAQFRPTHVVIAPTVEDLGFPELAQDAERLVTSAAARWTTLWDLVRREHGARVIQHSFVVPDQTPLGHLSARLPESRIAAVRELNRSLALAAGNDVLLVDCERLAAGMGKRRWLDPRLWYAARQPLGHEAQAVLARETAAVLAGDLGLGARCLVVDLDNTLWGGVVGEEGVDGIAIGQGSDGEAYAAFQEYLGALAQRGVLLAVASKNDREAAQLPFEHNAGMRLKLSDFAAFVADWRRKPEQIVEIANTLGLGLASIVFADDNPAECAEVAAALAEVSVIRLDVPASELVRELDACARFEISTLSRDDLARQRSYAARAQAQQLEAGAASLQDFWRSLEMRARVRDVDAASFDRVAALVQKTNQFNLTLRRHTREEIERLAQDGSAICKALELEDRFASHGLIGLGFALPSDDDPDTALIETLLLSCRVIGRTAEVHLLSHLARDAAERGFARMRGVYVPGPRNALVAELYPKLGFVPVGDNGNSWEYDLKRDGPIESAYISEQA
jgi:FkbH-like protein